MQLAFDSLTINLGNNRPCIVTGIEPTSLTIYCNRVAGVQGSATAALSILSDTGWADTSAVVFDTRFEMTGITPQTGTLHGDALVCVGGTFPQGDISSSFEAYVKVTSVGASDLYTHIPCDKC